MKFIDTHCHIQEIVSDGDPDDVAQAKWFKAGITEVSEVIDESKKAGVSAMMTVGCSLADSKRAIELTEQHENVFASIGIHPHEAKLHQESKAQDDFRALASIPGVKAVGECGLDYFYEHSPKSIQVKLLEFQLQVAVDNNLPVIFHVREAFADFWPILANFPTISGVLHSFTDSMATMERAVERGLYIGQNGIITFTRDQNQLDMSRSIPLDKLLLETDAPFLTPKPYRGTICKPKHVVDTARFLSVLRGESLEELARTTTHNAKELFRLS